MSTRTPAHPYVVAVSGISGSGKTTLCQLIAQLLGDATTLHFDDYATADTLPANVMPWMRSGADPETVPVELAAWVRDGVDPDRIHSPELTRAVRALRSGTPVVHPRTHAVIQPARWLIVDEPFGRERSEIAELIDFVVYIDLPLDIGFLRRLRRDTAFAHENILERASEDASCDPAQHCNALVTEIERMMSVYLCVGRAVYSEIQRRVSRNCDLSVDGMLAPELLAEKVAAALRAADGC
jgi:uridine kinase